MNSFKSLISRAVPLLALSLMAWDRPAAASLQMYWTDHGNIYRSNADGTGVQSIFTASATNGRAGWIDIDPVTNLLYWRGWADSTNIVAGTGVVKRMNLDGSGLRDVLTGLHYGAYGFAIDSIDNLMYFGDHPNGLFRASLDGTG